VVNEEALTIDFESLSDTLTFEDMELIEEMSGSALSDFPAFGGSGKVTTKMLKALVFVAMRKDDPTVTVEDVNKLRISAVFNATPLEEESPKGTENSDSTESASPEKSE
jgi:hypothetical protein